MENFAVRNLLLVPAVVGAILAGNSIVFADEKAPETVEVKLKDLTLRVPKSWTQSDAVMPMRLATFEIPAVKGDQSKAELTVSTAGGGVGPNIERWIGQFDAEGRDAVIKQGKAGDTVYYFVDISGTYQKSVGPPVLQKKEAVKNARMLGVILEVKGKGLYFLKLTGPDATVKAQGDALRASFGAKADGEEDYEL
jgi:hypothetical protein